LTDYHPLSNTSQRLKKPPYKKIISHFRRLCKAFFKVLQASVRAFASLDACINQATKKKKATLFGFCLEEGQKWFSFAPPLDEATNCRRGEIVPEKARYETHTYKCGEVLEVEAFPFWEIKGRGRKKGQTTKPTRHVQKKLNHKNAKRHLERLLNLNFQKGRDVFLTVTHTDENAPQTEAEAKKCLENYLRRLRYFVKQHDELSNLKYIAVTEWKKSSTGIMKPHYHIVLNIPDRDAVERLWGHGRTNARILQADPDGGLQGLAKYFVGPEYSDKDAARQKHQRRYNASNNLKQPKHSTAYKKISARQASKVAKNYEEARSFFEKLHPGYIFQDIDANYYDFVGGAYLYVRMKRKN